MAKAKSDQKSPTRSPSKTKEEAAAKRETPTQRGRGEEEALVPAKRGEEDSEPENEPEEENEDEGAEDSEEGGENGEEGDDSEALAAAGQDDASKELEGSEDGASPAQLGTERYVLAGFFAAGMIAAYIFGKFIHGVWAYLSNKDWFSQALPSLTAVGDDEKTSISLVIGAIVALITVLRTFRRPDVRTWSDDVAGELAKVKWPDRKEVYNATVVVIAASAIATIYLALLDRLWGFITNLIYGDGS